MTVITRIWHGTTRKEHAEKYLAYVESSGIKAYKATSGNLSTKILRRIEDEICHFWTVTEWDSIESIKKFAGEDYEKAQYYPDDEKFLLNFEEHVRHFETFTY